MRLRINDEDIVLLHGYFDDDNALQFRHGDEELSAHDDRIEVAHDGKVTVRMQIASQRPTRVEHEDDDGLITWTLGDAGHEHGFASNMTDAAEINVMERDGTARHKTLHIKVTPKGALPDR